MAGSSDSADRAGVRAGQIRTNTAGGLIRVVRIDDRRRYVVEHPRQDNVQERLKGATVRLLYPIVVSE